MTKCNKCYRRKFCLESGNYRNAENCKQYKNEENLVELPCKVGNKLFEVSGGEIYIWEVTSITIYSDEYIEFACVDTEFEDYEEDFQNSDIGKTVFLTYEEAVKALEDRND